MDYGPGKGMGKVGLNSGRHQEGPLFPARICFSWTKGVLFLSGKVLSVIHRAWSDVSRPRRYHLLFALFRLEVGFLLGQIGFVHLFCLGGTWDLSWKYPLLFCFVPFGACMSPLLAGVWEEASARPLRVARLGE